MDECASCRNISAPAAHVYIRPRHTLLTNLVFRFRICRSCKEIADNSDDDKEYIMENVHDYFMDN